MVASLCNVVCARKLFSPEECATIAESPGVWSPAQVHKQLPSTVGKGKQADWKLMPLETGSTWVYARLAGFLEQHATYGFEIECIESPLKVQRYEVGGFHRWHTDLGFSDRRKLGITVQLSSDEDYQGGSLQFFRPPEHVVAPRAVGCGICFASFVPHEVTTVTAGTRYALTAWVVGPPFR